MVNFAGRPTVSFTDQVGIVWWRAVIVVTRWLNHSRAWALPIILPIKPLWWVPLAVMPFGFLFGLMLSLVLA
ncbi:MAG: hypothetical protein IT317_06270 [Anaerolineales bacterium]|nr:hypothetical protein [Anaerolineales bacterium]